MEPLDGRGDGVSHERARRGAWRSLLSGRGDGASSGVQVGPHTVDGVGAGDQRRPFAELSPEEQAERRREAARKAAATRARNRARQARSLTQTPAEGAVPQPVEDSAREPVDAQVAPVPEPAAEREPGIDAPSTPEVVVEDVQSAEPEPAVEPEPAPESDLEKEPIAEVDLAPEPIAEPERAVVVEPERASAAGLAAPEAAETSEDRPAATSADRVADDPVEHPADDPSDEHVEVVGVQSAVDETVDVAPGLVEADGEAAPVVLRLVGVTRRFGSTLAVDDVHLEVRAGECHGIVGPNGAGKSTTVSLAGGLMRPSSGSVEVGGADVRVRGVQTQLGVVPDRMRLFDRLTGRQLLVHAALLRRVPRKQAMTRAATLLERFELMPDADRLVSDYSIGMQQLVGIAAALIHAPRVVVLDEPFESIDPVATDTILSILGDLRRRGGAVVLTSHDMALVERACDHVVVLQDGVVRASGPIGDVRDGLSLEDRFARLVGSSPHQELPWLSPSLD